MNVLVVFGFLCAGLWSIPRSRERYYTTNEAPVDARLPFALDYQPGRVLKEMPTIPVGGVYYQEKWILGYKITVKVTVTDKQNVAVYSTSTKDGIVDCPTEPFKIGKKEGTVHEIVLVGIEEKDNCFRKELAKREVAMESMSYDEKDDTITMVIWKKWFFWIKQTMTLKRQSN